MSSESISSRVMAGAMLIAAVLMTGAMVRRQMFTPLPPDSVLTEVDDWGAYVNTDEVIGPSSAPVKVVVFSDYQCPFCKEFALHTWPAVQRAFGDSVQLLHRNFPLPNHSEAIGAAEAAACATAQGQFGVYHAALFDATEALGRNTYLKVAAGIEMLDSTAFAVCLESRATESIVLNDLNFSVAAGITATPTIVINGRRLAGSGDSTTLSLLVRDALKSAPKY